MPKFKTHLLIVLFFTTLSIVITWPLIINFNRLIIDPFDGLLITWIYNWNIHSLITGPGEFLKLLNTNIFFPNRLTYAFSDYHLVGAVLAAPLVLLTGEPLVAYNLNFILGFVLTGYSLFLLLRLLTNNNRVSLLGSILFVLSPLHLGYMPHPQLFGFWSVIFPLYFLVARKYRLFSLFTILAVLSSALNIYFLLFLSGVYAFYDRKERWTIFKVFLITGLFCSPLLFPYLMVSRIYHYVRPINDAIHFSLQFPDLLNVASVSKLSKIVPAMSAGTPAFFGLSIFILIIITAFSYVKERKFKGWFSFRKQSWALMACLGSLVLAMGPALHIFSNTVHIGPLPAIPLPYLLFYYLLPGFSGFRTPSRWVLLTLLTLVIAMCTYWRKRMNLQLTLILIILAVLEVNLPIKYFSVPTVRQFPPEQIWLKSNFVRSPIIQFPIYNWSDNPGFGQETLREYYSTVHWHPMFNGFSGFSPVEWEKEVVWLQTNFPSDQSFSFLKQKGIALILVPRNWEARMSIYPQAKPIALFPDTIIYKLQ